MIKNKRFWIGLGSIVVWSIGVLLFKQDPLTFATGLTFLVTPYIAGETLRPSTTTTTVTEVPPDTTITKTE